MGSQTVAPVIPGPGRCQRASKLMYHSYQVQALEPASCTAEASSLEPGLHKGGLCSERLTHCNCRKPTCSSEDQNKVKKDPVCVDPLPPHRKQHFLLRVPSAH